MKYTYKKTINTCTKNKIKITMKIDYCTVVDN